MNRRERLRAAFGAVIRERRIKAGMTQEKLSFRAKVHRTYIGDLERGLKSPTLDVIDALATALNADPNVLIEQAAQARNRPVRDRATEISRNRVKRTR